MGRAAATVMTAMVVALVLMGTRAPREADAATTLYVTSSADAGPGSLRAAVAAANADPSVTLIVLTNRLPVTLYSSVEYTGAQALTIQGDQPVLYRTIQGSLNVPGNPNVEPLDCGMFKITGGADITFTQVTVQHSWCDALNIVPAAGDAEITITLNRVVLRNNFGSALFLHEVAEAEGAIRLNVTSSLVVGNGRCRGASGCAFGGIELQGLGQGEVIVQAAGAAFNANGGNGLSISWSEPDVQTAPAPVLDVDITVTASYTTFNDNGGAASASVALGAVTARRGDASIASHQPGDGIGVYGSGLGIGDVAVTLTDVQARGNAADGVFVGAVDDGDVGLTATTVTASGNGGGGIDVFEGGVGDAGVAITSVSAWSNGDAGVTVQEEDEGDVDFDAVGSSSSFNRDHGFDVNEAGDGALAADFRGLIVSGNGGDGLAFLEEVNGVAGVTMRAGAITGNAGAAIDFTAGNELGTIVIETSFLLGPVVLENAVQVG